MSIIHDIDPRPTLVPSAPLCPDWCTRGAGHAPDLVDSDGALYVHRGTVLADAGGRHLALRQAVSVPTDSSVTREIVDPAEVVLDGEALTLAETRALLAGLALAAAVLEGGVPR